METEVPLSHLIVCLDASRTPSKSVRVLQFYARGNETVD